MIFLIRIQRLHTTNSENNKPIPRSENNQGRAHTLENNPPFIAVYHYFRSNHLEHDLDVCYRENAKYIHIRDSNFHINQLDSLAYSRMVLKESRTADKPASKFRIFPIYQEIYLIKERKVKTRTTDFPISISN